MRNFCIRSLTTAIVIVAVGCAPTLGNDALSEARQLLAAGKFDEALRRANAAVGADPLDAAALVVRSSIFESFEDYAAAEEDLSRAIELAPPRIDLHQQRGGVRFKRGDIAGSIEDFDRYLAARPDREPHHWQRGISYYYAGEFAKGARQFEGYQSVDDNDVENAVWHFLCLAREQGVDAARGKLLKVRRDPRVPLMEVYALFAGQAQPADVLAAARAGDPSEDELRMRQFYAHLYLGLYYEALADAAKAREHLATAARDYKHPGHYMWCVAQVHADRLANPAEPAHAP